MATAREYRTLAAAHRVQASQCDLRLVRERYVVSAERWEALAEEIERSEWRQARVISNAALQQFF